MLNELRNSPLYRCLLAARNCILPPDPIEYTVPPDSIEYTVPPNSIEYTVYIKKSSTMGHGGAGYERLSFLCNMPVSCEHKQKRGTIRVLGFVKGFNCQFICDEMSPTIYMVSCHTLLMAGLH